MAPDLRDIPPPPAIPAAAMAQRQYSPRRPVKSMDEILKHIQSDWKNMEGDECVPVKVALQLMDPSSLGLGDKEPDFSDTHVDLQKSLKKVVNEHYADFNSAVGTYHKIQASIRESQSRVRYLKNGLVAVKGGMLTTRPELRGLAEQSGELDGLLSVLAQMEALREMPTRLEERINEKRWIAAVELLNDALRTCRKSELDGIGAMSDLRNYFATQETSLVDVLVEELHDHLYLKSPYCVDRWKGQAADGGEKDAKDTFGGNTWDRPVYAFLAALDASKPMVEDASKNPEADTFSYIHMIIEALNKAGYLEETVARIEQRMPVELYKVVDRTNNETDVRYPSHLRGNLEKGRQSLRMLQPNDSRTQILSDFLWTLYAKFEAIAEGHRVLHEVVMGITKRENLSKPEKYVAGFKELWKLYQMEIRSLLHDYLAADGDMTLGKGLKTTTGTDLFAKQSRDKNRKLFKLSEMDEKNTDLRAEAEELDEILKSSVPGLVSKSRTNMGINTSADRNAADGTAAGHKLLIEPSVFNMTILLPPSLAFLQHLKDIVPQTSNIAMSTLTSFLDDFLINVFHPQLEEAVTELCTQCMMDIEAFIEDSQWSQYSPHPVFKGTTAFMSLMRAFSGMLSSIPQDQMFTQLIIAQLVTYYDKCYAFYRGMVTRVVASPTNPNANTITLKAAASFAESGELHDAVSEMLKSDLNRTLRRDLSKKAVQYLLASIKTTPISSYDIISDPKTVHQMSLLYNSMQWLSSSLSQLRHVETNGTSRKTHSRNASQASHAHVRRWTLITTLKTGNPESQSDTVAEVFLPLSLETAVAFDTTLHSLRTLAQQALLTLYLDVRCGIVHQLGRALRPIESEAPESVDSPDPATRASTTNLANTPPPLESGLYPFVLPSPPSSASPRILELNNDLISFDANISAYLGLKERKFILTGLGLLVDRYLVVGADYIQVMNKEGAERMRVDAMVLQQVLRGLVVDSKSSATEQTHEPAGENSTTTNGVGLGISSPIEPTFKKNAGGTNEEDDDGLLAMTARYYELFLQGPEAIMQSVKERKEKKSPQGVGFTYDELRTLIELCFSATIRGPDREEAIKARRKMDDLLLQLGEVMWDS